VSESAQYDISQSVNRSLAPAGVTIAIPLYKAAELISGLFASLIRSAEEISALSATILLINDSPDHRPLIEALEEELPALRELVSVEILTNPENIGFVRTANRAFAIAIERGHDVILLNSDALPMPGAFIEMAVVSQLDPMIGFVSPRSNNASICNSPWPDHFRGRDTQQSLADHQAIAHLLPRYTLAPTAVGFCLYVRRLMLLEFGLFDEVYAGGYNEENDLIRRCNRRGFRAALANYAYVYHIGSASFMHSSVSTYERELVNGAILRKRYPEYDTACHRYFTGAGHRAERLLAGLIPTTDGKLRILFHCDLLKASFNGTFELAKKLIAAFAERHNDIYEISIYSDEDAFLFHGMNEIAGLRRCSEYEMRSLPFAVAFRLAQPFTLDDVTSLPALAPVTGSLMLDTIALDCQQIDPSDLDMLWRLMAETSDIIGYISAFSRDQFRRRFDVPDTTVEFVALCSTDTADYASDVSPVETVQHPARPTILIVGNHYPHKHVRETLAELRRRAPDRHVSLLGVEVEGSDNLASHNAGLLPQALVDSLYAEADVVLFPSHYEGFGLPIMRALARGKRVVARDLPPAREIQDHTALGDNIHLAATTEELVGLALAPPDWRPARRPAKPVQNWHQAADSLASAFADALGRVSYERCRRHQAKISARDSQASEARIAQMETRAVAAEDMLTLLSHGRAAWGHDLIDRLDLCIVHGHARSSNKAVSASVHDPIPDDVSDPIATLTLTDGEICADFGLIENQVLRWAAHLLLGASLHLDLAQPTLFDPAFPDASPMLMAKALLVNAGFAPLRFTEYDGRLTADAIRITDWASILPGPDSDILFVRLLYRHILGREPDPQGEATFVDLLARGDDRESTLRAIYRSIERRAYVLSRISTHQN